MAKAKKKLTRIALWERVPAVIEEIGQNPTLIVEKLLPNIVAKEIKRLAALQLRNELRRWSPNCAAADAAMLTSPAR